jgi:beta-glucanase (GH16 family)
MGDQSPSAPGPAACGRTRRRAALAALLVAGIVAGCGGGAGPTGSGEPDTASAIPAASASSQPLLPVASSSPVVSSTVAPSAGPTSWNLVWSDEFDGPAGAPPDPTIWGYDLGDGTEAGIVGWGNNEREYYTDSPENAATDGEGYLLITVRRADGSTACYYGPCEYASARLLTKDRYEFQYGRIEARIKVPGGVGLWPAFWMLGTDIGTVGWPRSGEIDIMEFVGRRPNEILGTIHGPGYSGSSGFTQGVDLDSPVADDFHTLEIDWRPGSIVWSLDGKPYHRASPADVAPNDWVFDHPFFLILNVAVGGNLGGPVAPDTTFPQAMTVDYVRLYQEAAP